MNTEQRIQVMTERLTHSLQPTYLEIIDESHLHKGHAGAQSGAGHFKILLASSQFTDKNLIACHRLVYEALTDLIPHEIHALKIQIQPEKEV